METFTRPSVDVLAELGHRGHRHLGPQAEVQPDVRIVEGLNQGRSPGAATGMPASLAAAIRCWS